MSDSEEVPTNVTPNNSPVSDAAIACSIDAAPLELPPSPVADSNDSDKFSVEHVEDKQEAIIAEAIDAVKDVVVDTVKVVKEPVGCVPKTMKFVKGFSKIVVMFRVLTKLIKIFKK